MVRIESVVFLLHGGAGMNRKPWGPASAGDQMNSVVFHEEFLSPQPDLNFFGRMNQGVALPSGSHWGQFFVQLHISQTATTPSVIVRVDDVVPSLPLEKGSAVNITFLSFRFHW